MRCVRAQGGAAFGLELGHELRGGFGVVKTSALQQQLAFGVHQFEVELAVVLAVLFEAGYGGFGRFAAFGQHGG